MEISQLILFLGLACIAEVLGTSGGFGSSVFFVPIAAFFFDFPGKQPDEKNIERHGNKEEESDDPALVNHDSEGDERSDDQK